MTFLARKEREGKEIFMTLVKQNLSLCRWPHKSRISTKEAFVHPHERQNVVKAESQPHYITKQGGFIVAKCRGYLNYSDPIFRHNSK